MRARGDLSGWEIETEVARELTKWNINVVMPVGGPSSFYADWNAPGNFLGLSTGFVGFGQRFVLRVRDDRLLGLERDPRQVEHLQVGDLPDQRSAQCPA